MFKYFLPLLLFFVTSDTYAQTIYTVETIPIPKIEVGEYVSNPDKVLSDGTASDINRILKLVEDSTTAQVAVAVVNSIGDAVPGDFRIQLLRHWGIGLKENNNGLLILMVMDQRRMEFESGYGLEGIFTDAVCKRIQMEFMIPLAKESRYDECVLAGVMEVSKILMNPEYRTEVMASSSDYEFRPWWRRNTNIAGTVMIGIIYGLIAFGILINRKKVLKSAPSYVKKNTQDGYLKSKFYALNLGVPSAFIVWQELTGSIRVFEIALFVYGFIALLLIEKRFRINKYIEKDTETKLPQDRYNLLAKSHSKGWIAASILMPLPFLFYGLFNRKRMRALRDTPPLAEDGRTQLIKLNEIVDDSFLNAFQLTEEKLKSVDYDVWKHPESNEIKIFRFENYYSKYSSCLQCKTKAYLMIKNETLVSPTYESTGTGMKTFLCSSCSYKNESTYTIAKRVKSSSSSNGGSGGGGGGGSSWGGGSSGGGGAGSSW